MDYKTTIGRLRAASEKSCLEGMARFGINTETALGVSVPELRKLAKEIGTDQGLSIALWDSGIHEARMLAGFVGDPEKVTERQMERWALEMDSWDICDQVCGSLFDKTPFAIKKINEWNTRKEEYVKRCAFTLMAALAVHDKTMPDSAFERFLPIIIRESADERNFVRKAVNWALRQIGKRNKRLNKSALLVAKRLKSYESKSARWIGSDAYRELTSPGVKRRLHLSPPAGTLSCTRLRRARRRSR